MLLLRHVFSVESYEQLSADFSTGAFCYGRELDEFFPGVSFEAFCNVGEDGESGASNLVRKCKVFRGETASSDAPNVVAHLPSVLKIYAALQTT